MARRKRKRRGLVRLEPDEVEKMRTVGRFAASLLDMVEKMIEPGITTGDIDRAVHEATHARGAKSAPYGYTAGGHYPPFPGHCCTSVNDVVCHGIPSDSHVLREGDIINVDVTPTIDGYHGDTSRTFLVGSVDPEARRLVDDTHEAMRRGIAAIQPGGTTGDIGAAILEFALTRSHSVVEVFAGHGIGRVFHGAPTISHVGRRGGGLPLIPGMTFTVEPMLNQGGKDCVVSPVDHWTATTRDGSLSAQFEHTVTVRDDGYPEVLTLAEGKTFDLTIGD